MNTKQKTLSDLIKICKFDHVNENIIKLFDYQPSSAKVEVRNFGKYMTSEEVIAELKKDGCRPATATEILTWYAEHQDWQPQEYFGVVALGSVVTFEGSRRVCSVWLGDARRSCGLIWCDGGWDADCWFAFSRETDTQTSALEPLTLDLGLAIKMVKEAGYVIYKEI